MNKTQLTKELQAATGGSPFASVNQICKALRIDKRKFLPMMNGVPYWADGKANRYMISDVAGVIASRSKTTGGGL